MPHIAASAPYNVQKVQLIYYYLYHIIPYHIISAYLSLLVYLMACLWILLLPFCFVSPIHYLCNTNTISLYCFIISVITSAPLHPMIGDCHVSMALLITTIMMMMNISSSQSHPSSSLTLSVDDNICDIHDTDMISLLQSSLQLHCGTI
jgi:hypothetical protein